MKEFDIKQWLPDAKDVKNGKQIETNKAKKITSPKGAERIEKVEELVQWVEATGTDLTSTYEDWLKIGFALADEFGQAGASYFHRISKFYSDYDYQGCEKQYKQCLQGNGSGITIATLFHYAAQAGYQTTSYRKRDYSKKQNLNSTVKPQKKLPTFTDTIYEELPDLLKESTKYAKNIRERDILLLGSLTVISACLPNVYGIYDDLTVYPNLYLFITAPASSGKGRVNLCRRLVAPIHKQKREETSSGKLQYEVELAEYQSKKSKDKSLVKPERPKEQILFIPANSSATGTVELLFQNEGSGLIFETEGDTLAQTFKSEYGNYSDGFRNAFHHETISYYRRTDSEYVEIPSPRISTVLTGTPDQVLTLMPDSQNGLFSRFMFYKMERQKKWRNVFANNGNISLDSHYDELGMRFASYYNTLIPRIEGIRFVLNQGQQKEFHNFFSSQYDKYIFLQKEDLEASLIRLGLICFRLAMTITTIRTLENEYLPQIIECEQRDFEIALAMIKVLLQHTEEVFLYLPKKDLVLPKGKDKKELFLDALPKVFTTQVYKEIGEEHQLSLATAKRYIAEFINKGWIHKKSHGNFVNKLKKGT